MDQVSNASSVASPAQPTVRRGGGILHRPEIDGLRAVAVFPVMMFHAGIGLFGGGYVGVDVFFVISGFLITTILWNEHLAGEFSIVRFYERRARRILPALFVVALACIPFGWLLMLPGELAGLGSSMASVAAFVSNIYFWRSSGYFDIAAEEKPLLHTWSLGVEEQYYVIFPVLVMLLWHLHIRRPWVFIAALAVASFAVSELMLGTRATAVFFLAPARAWELLAGSLLAIACCNGWRPAEAPRRARDAIALLGSALILVPVFVYDASTPFPGRNALPPVVGTLLLIAFATPDTGIGRILTRRPVVSLGLMSYSAYLWHQPLFAFARLGTPGAPSTSILLLFAALAIGLAYLSWRWVETPFRDRSRWSQRSIFIASGLATGACIVAGMLLAILDGVPQRWSAEQQRMLTPTKTEIDGCPAVDGWLHLCPLGAKGKPATVALVGDSHAYAIGSALDEALRERDTGGFLVHTTCHPIAGILDGREDNSPARVAYCAEAYRRLLAFIGRSSAEVTLVAIRWTGRLYPMQQSIDAPAFDNYEGGIEQDYPYRRNVSLDEGGRLTDAAVPKARALRAYLEGLAALKRTVVLYPVPEVGWNPPRLNLIAFARGLPAPEVSTSWERFGERNAAAIQLLDGVENVLRSRPESLLCNTLVARRCVVQAAGKLYYADDDHLSQLGARLVVNDLLAVAAR